MRRELGVRTIFNALGPLANPAGASRQMIGVGRPELVRLLADALASLGTERAIVFHSDNGLDELVPGVAAFGVEIQEGWTRPWRYDPATLRQRAVEMAELAGSDADGNAAMLRRLLEGEAGRAPRDGAPERRARARRRGTGAGPAGRLRARAARGRLRRRARRLRGASRRVAQRPGRRARRAAGMSGGVLEQILAAKRERISRGEYAPRAGGSAERPSMGEASSRRCARPASASWPRSSAARRRPGRSCRRPRGGSRRSR